MVCFNPTNFAYSWKRKTPKFFEIQGFTSFCLLKKWCHQDRKSVCIALFLNKLYLYYDVSSLNKVFTALHRLTSVCILGTISECKDRR